MDQGAIFPDGFPGVRRVTGGSSLEDAKSSFQQVFFHYNDPREGPVLRSPSLYQTVELSAEAGLIPHAIYQQLMALSELNGDSHYYMSMAEGGDPFSGPHGNEVFQIENVPYEAYSNFHRGSIVCLYWSSTGLWGVFGDGDDWKVTVFHRKGIEVR